MWLDSRNIDLQVQTRKLGDRQLGPFKILEKIGELNYKLDLPHRLRQLHPVFHVDRLSPWKGNDVNGVIPPPPEPDEVEGALEYEVEKILDAKLRYRKMWFLVQWKGYGEEHDQWEPEMNLAHAKEAIEEFYAKHQDAPRRINANLFHSIDWRPLVNFTDPPSQSLRQPWDLGSTKLHGLVTDDKA